MLLEQDVVVERTEETHLPSRPMRDDMPLPMPWPRVFSSP
jgi:hypothetical protein